MNKIFYRSYVVLVFLFVICGSFSYLSLGTHRINTADLIIFRQSIWPTDYMMSFCRVLALFSFLIGAVIGCFVLKDNILLMLGKKQNQKYNLGVSALICLAAAVLGQVKPQVKQFFSLAGTFTCSFFGVIIPYYMALKIGYVQTAYKKLALIVMLVVICLTTVGSMVIIVMRMIERGSK